MDKSILSMYNLEGKVAIVTGASQGLGLSLARGLAKAGCDLLICARNFDKLKQVAEEIEKYGHKVIPLKVDVTVTKDIQKMADKTNKAFGKIDILVNNAGIGKKVDAENMTSEEWQSVIDTNLTGLFMCAQRVGRYMLKQGYGKIINIASMYSFVGASCVGLASYVASKHGVMGLTRTLAVEWAPRGLQIIAVVPGFLDTAQNRGVFDNKNELGKKLLAKVPMGRLGDMKGFEGSIVYLASSASNYMNGSALILDGGFLAL